MLEVIAFALAVVVIIMGWKYFTRSADWIADNVGRTGELLEDLTVGAGYQTQRGVIISRDGLMDSVQESRKKQAKRTKESASFLKGLDDDQKKDIGSHDAAIQKILKRQYK